MIALIIQADPFQSARLYSLWHTGRLAHHAQARSRGGVRS